MSRASLRIPETADRWCWPVLPSRQDRRFLHERRPPAEGWTKALDRATLAVEAGEAASGVAAQGVAPQEVVVQEVLAQEALAQGVVAEGMLVQGVAVQEVAAEEVARQGVAVRQLPLQPARTQESSLVVEEAPLRHWRTFHAAQISGRSGRSSIRSISWEMSASARWRRRSLSWRLPGST